MDQDPTPLQDGWGGEAGGNEQLEQLERLICRLEARRAASCDLDEGPQPPSPTTPRALTPTSAPTSRSYNFWRDVSPQLSYIDGSTTSSGGPAITYGRSVSWNLTDLDGPKAFLGEFDDRCHNLDVPDHRPSSDFSITPLPSLKPLSRYASDSICSPGAPPAQHAVVQVEKGDIKTKIQKRLSFGDTLDLSTNIYTPAEDDDEGMTTGLDSGGATATVNGSSTSLERKWTNDEDSCPPLVRRKSLDTQSQYSYYMDKDLRYYFQHPWLRLIVAYLVIFCNFLLFAEDPVSHSHTGKLKNSFFQLTLTFYSIYLECNIY